MPLLKKLLFGYVAVWFVLAGLSLARYISIWNGTCYFQTMGWLWCVPEPERLARIGSAAGIVVMFTLFLVVGWLLWKHRDQLVNLNPVLKKLLLVSGLCAVFILPLGMSDWPYYFSAGKAVSSNINLYVEQWTHQVDFSSPMYKGTLIGFSYGPVMATIFKWLYMASQGRPEVFLLIWKFIMLLTLIGAGIITMKLVKLFSDGKNAAPYYLLWFAQPVFLFEWVVNVHFDGFWLLFLLLAIYAARAKRWWLVFPALIIGVWIKFIPVLLFPFFALWWWQELNWQNWKKLLSQMSLGLGIAGLISVLSWWPYWAGPQVFSSLVLQSKWVAWSWFGVIYYSLKPLFMWFLGDQTHWYLTRLAQAFLLAVLIYTLYPMIKKCLAILFKKARWEDGEYIQAMIIFLLAYLLIWQKSFTPWYGAWFIPLGLIAFQKYRHPYIMKIITWFSSAAFIFHIVFIIDWFSKDPGAGGQLWFNYLIVGSIVVYPLYLIFRWRQKNYAAEEIAEVKV